MSDLPFIVPAHKEMNLLSNIMPCNSNEAAVADALVTFKFWSNNREVITSIMAMPIRQVGF